VLCSATYAQITPIKTFDYSANSAMIDVDEYVYYIMDVPNNECRIYPLDSKPEKTIVLDVPENNYLSDISYLNKKIFNTDELIELFYTFYEYRYNSDSIGYYYYETHIANENSEILLKVPHCTSYAMKHIAPQKIKLFCYCTDYSVSPVTYWTTIFIIENNRIAQEITLKKGWNLVSFYTLPDEKGVAEVFGNSFAYIDEIKDFEGAYNENESLSSLQTIQFGNAYFIKANTNCNIYVTGTSFSSNSYSKQLSSGWNLVGSPFVRPLLLNEIITTENKDNIECIKSLNNHTDFSLPSFTSRIQGLSMGQGYLLKTNKASSLDMTINK